MTDPITATGPIVEDAEILEPAEQVTSPEAGGVELPANVPWEIRHRWSETVEGGSGTYADQFRTWVAAHYDELNDEEYLCNWFPLRALTGYAAEHGLRVKLKYWPGSAPTDGGERDWDTSQVLVYDSHGGDFGSWESYYYRVANRVTARMVGELNTVPIARGEAAPGDLLVYDYSDAYWHLDLIIAADSEKIVEQSGTRPKAKPADREETHTELPSGLYGGQVRRWDFSQFD